MIVYSFPYDDASVGSIYCGSLKEARTALKECLDEGDEITISKHETAKINKMTVIDCLNNVGWCVASNEVETWAMTTCEDREVKNPCSGCGSEEGCDRIVLRKTT